MIYEHLVFDITPVALRYVGFALDKYTEQFVNIRSETLIELENFRNEIHSRLQRRGQVVVAERTAPPNNEDLI